MGAGGTLVRKPKANEYLNGQLFKINKETNEMSNSKDFNYRNPSEDEVDEILEVSPLPNMQIAKKSNVIYTSDPIKFSTSDKILLEDQGERKRNIKKIYYDRRKSKRTDMRLRGKSNKELHLGKMIILE